MWWLMMIGIILLWIGVIALVVWLIRTWTSQRAVAAAATGAVAVPLVDPAPAVVVPADGSEDATLVQTVAVEPAPPAAAKSPAETPLQILDRRYAAGDIDRKDYLQRKADLEPPSTTEADTKAD
jgi:hypothetical protein